MTPLFIVCSCIFLPPFPIDPKIIIQKNVIDSCFLQSIYFLHHRFDQLIVVFLTCIFKYSQLKKFTCLQTQSNCTRRKLNPVIVRIPSLLSQEYFYIHIFWNMTHYGLAMREFQPQQLPITSKFYKVNMQNKYEGRLKENLLLKTSKMKTLQERNTLVGFP